MQKTANNVCVYTLCRKLNLDLAGKSRVRTHATKLFLNGIQVVQILRRYSGHYLFLNVAISAGIFIFNP